MRLTLPSALFLIAALTPMQKAVGQVLTYTDEAAFLTALTAHSLPALHEGFEDDAVWGGVRSTVVGGAFTAPTVVSQGVTWSGSSTLGGITTGSGPARSGNWAFFQLPHGDWANGIRDGWRGQAGQSMAAIGGWITSTGTAVIELRLDGVAVDFGGNNHLTNAHQFFGAIDPAGFSQFEWEEMEATPGDWKLIFADDFTFAFGGQLIDCNQNGVGDALDISSGTSGDCNLNAIPDECEIASGSSAPGGPFFCTTGCAVDCNNNGLLDSCEVTTSVQFASGPLSPIGASVPQSFSIPAAPTSVGPVVLDFQAEANLGGADEFIEVELNGVPLGTLFVHDGSDCPDLQADTARLVIPAAVFNAAVGGGAAHFEMIASTEVDANDCATPTFLSVQVILMVPSALDGNANGILDACEGLGIVYCNPAQPNSFSAAGANMHALGSAQIANNDLEFVVQDLPLNQFALLINGSASASTPFPGGSLGVLCVGGMIGRHKLDLAFSGGTGSVQIPVDLNAIPTPFGTTTLFAGDTRFFQLWFRDMVGGNSVNNFSDALQVSFF